MDNTIDPRNVCGVCGTTLTGTKTESGWSQEYITTEYKWSKGEWEEVNQETGDSGWDTEECEISISCPNESCPVCEINIDEDGNPIDEEDYAEAVNRGNAIAEEEAAE
jgi:predicted nucleic acid-binding Zn ribbon protein